ncbi:MAG: hypothetical protein K2M50_03940 [Treponemataceae bacterium]|nr:hypothetical protein [Treponemataceae bacterium]
MNESAGGVVNGKENGRDRGGVLLFLFGVASCNSSEETVIEQPSYKYGVSDDFEIKQDLEKDIFDRHRFAPKDGTFSGLSKEEIGGFGWRLYKHAEKYLTNELAEFNKAMQKESNATFRNLAQEMENNNAFKRNVITIDYAIARNNNECAELFANMIYPLDEDTGYTAIVCFEYLANRAYNDSLGQKAGTMSRANRDLAETKQELQELGIAANDHAVESKLYNLLTPMSEKTGVSVNTLRRGVNLALCTAGMHGARDLGGSAEALSNSPSYVTPGAFQSTLGEWSKNDFTGTLSIELRHLWNAEHAQTMDR